MFEAISKINRGYKPNKKERNNLKVFDDFILEILSKSKSNEVIIHHKYDNKLFRFEKDYSGYYFVYVKDNEIVDTIIDNAHLYKKRKKE